MQSTCQSNPFFGLWMVAIQIALHSNCWIGVQSRVKHSISQVQSRFYSILSSNWTCGGDDKNKVLLRRQTISRERNETSSLRLGTPAHGVYALGVPYCTPLKLPLCTPVIGVQPQSTFQKCLEFWSDALHGVPIQMPWLSSLHRTFSGAISRVAHASLYRVPLDLADLM